MAEDEKTGEAPVVDAVVDPEPAKEEPKPDPEPPANNPYGMPPEPFSMLRAGAVFATVASGRYNVGHPDEASQALRDADAMLHRALTEPYAAK